jgi:hypothetical protein
LSIANETTSSTAVLVVRSSVACANERGMVLLATFMESGPHWVGKVSTVTGAIRRETDTPASSRNDWGSDVNRILHVNDGRVAILKEPTNIGSGGASRVALKRRKRKMGRGNILTAYTVGR